MNVNIESEVFGQMVGAAVMASITQEQRDLLIKQAITHLLAPTAGNYGQNPSPLQKAFNQAVENYARKFVEKEMEADGEFAAKVKSVLVDASDRVLTGEGRGKLVEKMSNAIADSFGPRY